MASLTEIFTAIADAIRSKNKKTTKYKPEDMSEAILNLSTTDIGAIGEGLVARNLSELDLGNATIISSYSLQNVGALKVKGDAVVTVQDYGLVGSGNIDPVLQEANLPLARTLGNYAFANNNKLTKVTVSDSVISLPSYLFQNDSSLTDFTLPSGLKSIYEGVFYGCSKYHPESLPSSVTMIGDSAFYQCSVLSLTSLPSGVVTIGISAFYQCTALALTSLPDGLVSIGSSAFYGCTRLAVSSLPSSITSIGAAAFRDCTNLTATALPENLTTLNENVFNDCSNLAISAIPDHVTSIGAYAMYNTGSVNLTIPDSVKTIGNYAFSNCTKLESVRIPAMETNAMGNHAFSDCTSLKRVEFASGSVCTTNYAFYNCTALEEVVFPPTFENIYIYSFYNCKNLRLTELPRQLQTLAGYAYYNCVLASFSYLPDTITGVYDHALQNCTGLTELRFHSTPENGIDSTAFQDCSNLSDIYVPWAQGAISNAPWGATNATIHYSTVYAATGITFQDSVLINITATTFDCKTILKVIDQDSYQTTGEATGLTWSAGTLTGATMDASTGVLTLSSPAANSTLQITATSENLGSAMTTLTFVARSYSVDLGNGQWVDTGTKINNNTVYKSDAGSYHINNGASTATITLLGYSKFVVYIRSNAESTYDYTIAGPLDATVSRGGSSVLTTSGKQSSSTYYKAEYTIPDNGTHTIQILYTKDNSQNNGDDRGYFYVAESECE